MENNNENEVANFVCENCDVTITKEDNDEHTPVKARGRRGRPITICFSCLESDFFTCYDCEEICHTDYSHEYGDDYICEDCKENNYCYCDGCSELVNNDNSCYCDNHETYFCSNCFDDNHNACGEDDTDNVKTKNYDVTTKVHQSDNHDNTKIVKSNRLFSAEVECYYPDVDTHNEVAGKIPEGFGIGFDGSLNSQGIEFQTALLSGNNGELAMSSFLELLNKNEYYTDKACGLHIHLDGNRFNENLTNIKKLMEFYLTFEDVIILFLPYPRRTNRFCRLLRKSYHIEEIMRAESIEDLESIWYRVTNSSEVSRIKAGGNKGHDSRYFGINFHCLLSSGHLEIRYHSGTINETKILEWVNLHARIMDCVANNDTMLVVNNALSETYITKKIDILFNFLELSTSSRKYFFERAKKFNTIAFLEERNYEVTPLSESDNASVTDVNIASITEDNQN